ncbi:hypothetical protein [Kurthia sibirica]|uniref:Uncharacterized protein n=1 Tax=Kurthia sibirica TaxID=202750 RepID=A0A2U3AJP7_9BACL|nr:hypothetical protein [Kurthia sibirica]PWI24694.1 hypothetical protein DEX24_12055 [Kurthia sibirica]GEK34536.1 hypothetical protein KSI01_20690 [Kurthia sibirica]
MVVEGNGVIKTYQLVIANAEIHEALDILPDRRKDTINEREFWYVDRYFGISEELKQAYKLKEAYCEWFDWAKTIEDVAEVKRRLEAFYRKIEVA